MSKVIVQYGSLMLTGKTAINFSRDDDFCQIELNKANKNEFPEATLDEEQINALIRVLKGKNCDE